MDTGSRTSLRQEEGKRAQHYGAKMLFGEINDPKDGTFHRMPRDTQDFRSSRLPSAKTANTVCASAASGMNSLSGGSRVGRRALIVEDDHDFQFMLSEALGQVPGTWMVNSFALGNDAIVFARSFTGNLDVALIDLGLPDMEGTQVIAEVRRRFADVPILVVSVLASEEKVLQALQAGATGYVLKDDDAIDIATSIDQVLRGNYPISPVLARCLVRNLARQDATPDVAIQLSGREEELLRSIAAGWSYAEAAHSMGVKTSTVHAYSKTLFRKLGVNSKTQAIAHARRHGLALP